MYRWGAALLALVGCGRIGFDGSTSVDGGAPADAFVGKWSLAQEVENQADTTISWSQDTAAGTVLIVAFNLPPGGDVTALTDAVGNAFTRVEAATSTDFQGPLQIWSAVNTDDASGDIQIDFTGPMPNAQVAWEVSGLTGAIDEVAALSDQPTTTTPASVAITTSKPGDFVVSIVKTETIESLTSPEFAADATIFFDGYAHLAANTAPAGTYQSRWTSTVSMFCTSAVAFFSD
ncbi:MAG TPA: hypothetical protein VGM90_07995 [Kofleriaceae bacterium]|jgi:hypothetical protein